MTAAIRSTFQGVPWQRAFLQDGILERQQGLSGFIRGTLQITGPLHVPPGLPFMEDIQNVFPKGTPLLLQEAVVHWQAPASKALPPAPPSLRVPLGNAILRGGSSSPISSRTHAQMLVGSGTSAAAANSSSSSASSPKPAAMGVVSAPAKASTSAGQSLVKAAAKAKPKLLPWTLRSRQAASHP